MLQIRDKNQNKTKQNKKTTTKKNPCLLFIQNKVFLPDISSFVGFFEAKYNAFSTP